VFIVVAIKGLPKRLSLAGQFLLLQLVILLLVLVAVAATSLAQSARQFRDDEGWRTQQIAENVAATSIIRTGLKETVPADALTARLEQVRMLSGASSIVITTPNLRIVAATDPGRAGQRLPLHGNTVLSGWIGTVSEDGVDSVIARVPVLDTAEATAGDLLGVAQVGLVYPTIWEGLGDATPDLLTYLGVGTALGALGSLLLSRRVKRQTFGLEPVEIRRLVEQREAMLYGVKEGVVGLDRNHRVTLVNEVAQELLALPTGSTARTLDELGCDRRLVDVLTGISTGQDQIVVTEDRVLTLNRRPISVHGKPIGSVTTLRDRTELVELQKELGVTRHTTDTLRAQAHEFTNQLHTISGLIQLGEYDDVVQYITALSTTRAQLVDEVTARVGDPALAALLIAKASLAAERGVGLRISGASRLDRLDELTADLVTVVGNLVDNALEAVGSAPDSWVEVHLRQQADTVEVVVSDSGPGIAPELAEEVFTRGFTTKVAADGGQRGFGLALTRLVCTRRGGDVTVQNEEGAVFKASLPITTGTDRR
jgi:sensor histidine kinase regulating citrate/malate metabolism